MFSQSPYKCRVEWGKRGAREAAERGDVTVIVDVLSFSSTVISAVHFGAEIFPYPPSLDGQKYANDNEAEFIYGRAEAASEGKATLSPMSFNSSHSNRKFVLCSLNGAYCTWIASRVPALLVGSLLNASSVARCASELSNRTKSNITIIPCGEKWQDSKENEDSLRPAIEDYLGAGAILSYLEGDKSPEAFVCMSAFKGVESQIENIIWDCGSGRELRERGFSKDVKHCSRLNVLETVPLLKYDHFVKL
ncbi:2-phosphosulfolactate phosphatase [Cytobacillus sp. FJAT-54145]|uniref:Probable 2-phosphosulfolactate phosphatase n=1 Tax=Cytobacillus spartinae TaxID=3299023 RepID=A0ABW6KC28_9BACI